jgi:Domain of unknown function (DUF4386)
MATPSETRFTALLLLVQGVLMFAPLAILGSAIGWPASLDEPASRNLPLILEQDGAVKLGYSLYLLYSILFWPLAALLSKVLARGENSAILSIASGFGALSALARASGLLRWLVAMPALAQLYVNAPPAARDALNAVYVALNEYGGSIGELLGVNLFAALWIGLTSLHIWQSRVLPRPIASFGFVVSLGALLPWLEVYGLDLGPVITLGVTGVQLWLLVLGGVLLLRASKPSSPHAPRAA